MCAAYVAWMERGRNFNVPYITVMCICVWWETLKHLWEWLIQLLSIRNCYFVLHTEILSKDPSHPFAPSFSPHPHSCEHATEVEMQQWGGKAAVHSDWIGSVPGNNNGGWSKKTESLIPEQVFALPCNLKEKNDPRVPFCRDYIFNNNNWRLEQFYNSSFQPQKTNRRA